MVTVCFTAVWDSFLVFDVHSILVHFLPDVALLCYSLHCNKAKEQGTCNIHLSFLFTMHDSQKYQYQPCGWLQEISEGKGVKNHLTLKAIIIFFFSFILGANRRIFRVFKITKMATKRLQPEAPNWVSNTNIF